MRSRNSHHRGESSGVRRHQPFDSIVAASMGETPAVLPLTRSSRSMWIALSSRVMIIEALVRITSHQWRRPNRRRSRANMTYSLIVSSNMIAITAASTSTTVVMTSGIILGTVSPTGALWALMGNAIRPTSPRAARHANWVLLRNVKCIVLPFVV